MLLINLLFNKLLRGGEPGDGPTGPDERPSGSGVSPSPPPSSSPVGGAGVRGDAGRRERGWRGLPESELLSDRVRYWWYDSKWPDTLPEGSNAAQLFEAIAAGDAASVASLVSKDPATLCARSSFKENLDLPAFIWCALYFDDLYERGDYLHGDFHKGFTPLMAACSRGDLEIASILIGAGARLDDADTYGYTPLMHALTSKNERLAVYLIEKGAPVNTQAVLDSRYCYQPATPLMLAVRYHSMPLIEALLAAGADAGYHDSRLKYTASARSPLDAAFRALRPDAAASLVLAGASIEADFDHKCGYIRGDEALFYYEVAIRAFGRDSEKASFYKDIYFRSNQEDRAGFMAYTAAKYDYSEIMKLVLAGPAGERLRSDGTIDAGSCGALSAILEGAATMGSTECLRLLLEAGACVSKVPSALHECLKYYLFSVGDRRTVYGEMLSDKKRAALEMLIGAGMRFDMAPEGPLNDPFSNCLSYRVYDEVFFTLLAGAFESPGRLKKLLDSNLVRAVTECPSAGLVRFMIDAGASPDAADAFGTPAIVAAARRREEPEFIDLLIERGAAADRADRGGNTALHIAAPLPGTGILSRLLSAGARADVCNGAGRTPLMVAIAYHNEPNAMLLIERGCDLSIPGPDGKSVRDLAASKGMARVADAITKRLSV